jgi:hypothetical protein
MRKQLLAGLALLSAAVATPALAAPSFGDVVECQGSVLACPEDDSFATVGAGNEFALSFGEYGIIMLADFANGSLTLNNANNFDLPGGFELPQDTFLRFGGVTTPFTSAALGATSGILDFDASKLGVDADGYLTLNLSGTTFLPSGSLQVLIDQPAAAVPEPATWALMILGFGAVGHAMRRRKAVAPRAGLA